MTKTRKIYTVVSWLLVVLCMWIIFMLSAQVAEDSQDLSDSMIDKIFIIFGIEFPSWLIRAIAHCLEFAGLSLLIFNATHIHCEVKRTSLIAFFVTVFYAITDEIHQVFVPGRAFQLSDILIDSIGALIGTMSSLIILKIILTIKERGNKNGSTQTI